MIELSTMSRPVVGRKHAGIALFSAGTVAFLLLAVASSTQAYSSLDLAVARWSQGVDLPGLAPLMAFVNFVTDGPMAVAAWAVAFGVLVLRGRPLEALAILGVLAVWIGASVVSAIVSSPAPEAIVEFARANSFPSGHVTGVITLYGLLSLFAIVNYRGGRTRILLPVATAALVALTSFGRLYAGEHWAGDVLGSWLYGTLSLVVMGWVLHEHPRGPLPHPPAAPPPPLRARDRAENC